MGTFIKSTWTLIIIGLVIVVIAYPFVMSYNRVQEVHNYIDEYVSNNMNSFKEYNSNCDKARRDIRNYVSNRYPSLSDIDLSNKSRQYCEYMEYSFLLNLSKQEKFSFIAYHLDYSYIYPVNYKRLIKFLQEDYEFIVETCKSEDLNRTKQLLENRYCQYYSKRYDRYRNDSTDKTAYNILLTYINNYYGSSLPYREYKFSLDEEKSVLRGELTYLEDRSSNNN